MELHFSYGGKSYFAVGFRNRSGGHEVRNLFFEGRMLPKDITHIRQQGEPRYTCYMFEGMMDYLSLLSLHLRKFPSCSSLGAQDYVALNSTSNVDKAVDALYGCERISCLLGDDDAGQRATSAIESAPGYRVKDAPHLYCEYKGLNDYPCGIESRQSVYQVQPVKRIVPSRKKGVALGMQVVPASMTILNGKAIVQQGVFLMQWHATAKNTHSNRRVSPFETP